MSSDVRPAQPGARDGRYRWVALAVIVSGTFVVVLDTSVVNVALPQIATDFGSLQGVEWIVTSYLLGVAVTMTMSGWLADRFGRKYVFITSLLVFGVGSMLCTVAPTTTALVAARVIQGFGGGLLFPVGMAIVYELFEPHERGRALGMWGIAALVGPGLGPIIGGYLATAWSWRWLFLINVPIVIITTYLSARLLRETRTPARHPFDLRGLLLAASGLTLLLLGLSEGETWGWNATATLVCLVGGAGLLTTFVLHALRVERPIIGVRLLGQPVFARSTIVICLVTAAQYARLVFVPLELQTVRGIDAFDVGLLLTPAAIGMGITTQIGGRLVDRIGAKVPVSVGATMLALSTIPLMWINNSMPLWQISAVLFVAGLGNGLIMMPSTVAGMNSVHGSDVADASAWRSLSRQIAAAIAVAMLTALLYMGMGGAETLEAGDVAAYTGFKWVYAVTTIATFGAALTGWFLPGKEGALAMQEERRREGALALHSHHNS